MPSDNNFFIGGDPLLYDGDMEASMQKLQALQAKRKAMLEENSQQKQQSEPSLWSRIAAEIAPLTDQQKMVLFSDEDYRSNDAELNEMIQSEILAIVRPRIESSEYGKKVLESQYKLVKDRKSAVIAEANKEVAKFNAFREASAENPNLTYSEFINSIGG